MRAPLAWRMRPQSLDEVDGQEALLARGAPLRRMIDSGRIGSLLFWGPPGCGKTTIARLIAQHTALEFVPFSAVTDGVARVREIVAEATARTRQGGLGTLLFVDEIHRFNRGQQDAFLPHVESGLITLVGATTENPSFEVNAALLSRLRVFVLQPLSVAAITRVLERALADSERGLGPRTAAPDALALLSAHAAGDARRALTALEASVALLPDATSELTAAAVAETLAAKLPTHDKGGDQHYDLISAFIKSMRGHDPQAALYWLARLLGGGEDPRFVARRMVRFASEDIGLADPAALAQAQAAADAYRLLGSPEGELALAQAAVYLATAPKSNRVYVAWGEVQRDAERTMAAPVPLHLRNAATGLMASLGYGAAYQYPPDQPDGVADQTYLPDHVSGTWYVPGPIGYEKDVAKRLAWWAARRGGASDA
ncbi:MAG: replication-associated recombination protein A [Gemmatimonadaceae bacterium]|nr:replication-associated recombination protein A [Gemmatimonadaceae bacterium]